MLKKFMGLVCLALTFSNCYAQNEAELIDYSYVFHPNRVEKFTNPFAWSVSLQCRAKFDGNQASFRAKANHNSGDVNGRHVKQGQVITINVSNGQRVNLTASGWATVEITNTSNIPMTVTCSI